MTNAQLASLLLFQLACLLLACRAVGVVTSRLGQPQVMAEMIAGFLLGPSLFGVVAPQLKALLFPAESMSMLYVVSQVGLVLYMFCVGMDFRIHLLLQHRRAAIGISVAGIIVPFVLGAILAAALLARGGLFPPAVNDFHAIVFMGAAMSITAFPMLARIISERGIAGTTVGSLALAAGATGDAVAWIILAVVSSLFTGNSMLALAAAGGTLCYGIVVFAGLQPLLRRAAARVAHHDSVPPAVLTFVLCLLAFSGWFTDLIGIHSVFGAFLLGVAVPRGPLSVGLRRTIEPLTTGFLVPLFFVYSGLNSQLTLVNTGALWAITGLIFLSACVGKGAACWTAARLAGVSPRDAAGVATLMNCRGMVELILLNIGLQQGLITPTLFTMMVLMAIGTTLMTGPLFGYLWNRSNEPVMDPSLAADRRF
jgi:Kef-type K+ transport system membrane component KefB